MTPGSPDFLALCSAAYPEGAPGPRPAMDALWTALFQLERWLFAVEPGDPTRPYVGEYAGQRWAFAFTDSGLLGRFVEQNGLRGPGDLLFLSMPAADARGWIEQAGERGLLAGVQFNFAGPGWFAPARSLAAIHTHLLGRGVIDGWCDDHSARSH